MEGSGANEMAMGNDATRWSSLISGLLDHYRIRRPGQQVHSLGGAGGFSGAEFWRVDSGVDCWCIRKWPREHPTEERLHFIHAVLQHAWQADFRHLPLPLQDRQGSTFVQQEGFFWEVTPWLAGDVVSARIVSHEQIAAAMKTLAAFHQAVASFPIAPAGTQCSPGMQDRARLLAQMIDQGLAQIRHHLAGCRQELQARGLRVLEFADRYAGRQLATVKQEMNVPLVLQPCIRDIHAQHVLFHQSQVSGIIDFGAMNNDTVATDVARLLGSLAGDDQQSWQVGMAAYQDTRPLTEIEQRFVHCFDGANVLLSPLNWLRWLIVEGRHFDDESLVLSRLDELIERLAEDS